jgi:hypothetical protein
LDALLVSPISEAAMVYSMATVYFDWNHPTTTNALSHAYQKLRVMVLLSVAAHSFVLLAPMQGQIDAGIGWVVLILWLLFLPGMIPLFGCFFLAVPVAVLEKHHQSTPSSFTKVMQWCWQLWQNCGLCCSSFQILGLMLFVVNHTILFFEYPILYNNYSLTEVDCVLNQNLYRLAVGFVYFPCLAAIKTFAYLKWRQAVDGSLDHLRQDMVKDEDASARSDDDQNEKS